MNTRQVQEYVRLLRRRADFLKDRIDNREDKEKSHHDRAEWYALKWITRYAEDTILTAAEHQSGKFKEKFNG